MFNNYTPIYTPKNDNSYNYHTPTCEPPIEEHYNFIDPWDKYLNSNEQNTYNFEHEIVINEAKNNEVDINMAKNVCIDNHYEQEVKNNYYENSCETEEQTKDCSFQECKREDYNSFGNEIKKNEHDEEIIEYNEFKQEQESNNVDNFLACSDNIPINFNSSLSVNNCRPDSSTHCEIPKDQPCDLNVSIIKKFRRIFIYNG